jgi:GNAT superfamily N-acetyltransferase
MTESDIRDAFTPNDYEGFVFDLAVTQTASGTWKIDGVVWDTRDEKAPVARYTRTLDPAHYTAKHDSLIVEGAYRYRGFAHDLLRKSFAFYRRNGIQFVDLDAVEDGVFLWPRYGWSPVGDGLRLVHAAIRDAYQSKNGEPFPSDATLPTYGPSIFAYDLGWLALQALHDVDVELLPMQLDLGDSRTIAILTGKGIL